MTATRWWVRMFARWQARIDSVKGQIQAISLAVTAYSTFSLVLQGFGLGRYVPYIGVVLVILGPMYAYLFFEGGVWNQVARDRADMSANYASPNQRIGSEFNVIGFLTAMKGRRLTDQEKELLRDELDGVFEDYRDGIDIDDDY